MTTFHCENCDIKIDEDDLPRGSEQHECAGGQYVETFRLEACSKCGGDVYEVKENGFADRMHSAMIECVRSQVPNSYKKEMV